ncbi:hypothetical protein O181_009067 [Austropuccinia psidii MF-1]|uniref:Uncharacterized protein n=1 Tax=Austropuccinia psidii MF-1 TaxID=1389203 RepID=A0A9Q3BQZ5_9BASI|nr:hypothetical protein [Austropuccinia psidii MF-1]
MICMAGDELYTSLPLDHKEKVTGCHHPYSSKPRMAHASLLGEKIVDDEDEKISLTQAETNGEPRNEIFTALEEGSWSNSEFPHPQMPLSQSMLEFSLNPRLESEGTRLAKNASQKEKQSWLKAGLPDNFHEMRSAVHAHRQFVLKVNDKDFSSLPAPPSTEEHEIEIQVAGHL